MTSTMNARVPMSLTATAVTLALIGATSPACSADSLTEAMTGGTVSSDLRLRYEGVHQDNALSNADAVTARLRFGYKTGEISGFGAFVEAEHLSALGSEGYNSTINGKTKYSVVADPEFTEMNQAYVSYAGLPGTAIKWGRQRLIFDNARFIGNVGWRQNEQTYDGFTLVNKSLPDTTVTLGYLNTVHRVFSDDSPVGKFKMSSPLLNVSYKGWKVGELVGYGYFLDYDTVPASSTETLGLRLKGSMPVGDVKLQYTAEYAKQSDYKSNPRDYSLKYYLIEGGVGLDKATFMLGHESLGSDGANAFQTPLATLHAFNGWADLFLTTPAKGLTDTYGSAATSALGVNLLAVYHKFRAEEGSATYGSEWDLQATKKIGKNYLVGVKYARYSADTFSVDTRKFWLWGEMGF